MDFSNLFPAAPSYLPGLLGEEQARLAMQQAQQQGLLGLGLGLLSSGGPSTTRQTLGQSIGQGLASGQQAYQSALQSRIQDTMTAMQLGEIVRKRQQEEAMRTIMPQIVETERQQGLRAGGPDPLAAIIQSAQAGTLERPVINQQALSQLRGLVDPETFKKVVESIKIQQEVMVPKEEFKEVGGALYSIKPGQQPRLVVSPTGKLTGDYANVALGLFGSADVNQLPPEAFTKIQQEILRQKEAGRTIIDMTGGQKGFENERALRNDFQGSPEYKAFGEMKAAYGSVIESLNQNTPIGDVAAATKIMKLLDPGSVVRESELGIAMQATGLLDRVRGYADSIIKGQRLNQAQKVQFEKLANDLFSTAVSTINDKRNQYSTLAQQYGFDPDRVVGKPAELPNVTRKAGGIPGVVDANAIQAEIERRKKGR